MSQHRHTFERQLAHYFKTRLEDHSNLLNLQIQTDTLWYIGSLLARFGSSEQLYSYADKRLHTRPLALLYKDAMEAPELRQRCLFLRQLGDLALFIGGLYPESYAKHGINKDYFVGMGGGAYDFLADNARELQHVFGELAANITQLLTLVANACAKESTFDASDILALYSRYAATGDEQAKQQLARLGIALPATDVVQ